MNRDWKKLEQPDKKVKIQWHGDQTRVRLNGAAEKSIVNRGDVVEVTAKQARHLFNYSPLWTFEGEMPAELPRKINHERKEGLIDAPKGGLKKEKADTEAAAATADDKEPDEEADPDDDE